MVAIQSAVIHYVLTRDGETVDAPLSGHPPNRNNRQSDLLCSAYSTSSHPCFTRAESTIYSLRKKDECLLAEPNPRVPSAVADRTVIKF